MFKEDTKEIPPFAKITKTSQAANPPSRTAREEWTLVHTYEEALKWHLKWTPWFTKDMIEGILKYAYPAEILKEEHGEELLAQAEPKKPTRRKASTEIKFSPIALKKTIRELDDKVYEEDKQNKEDKDEEISTEEIEKRFNRFWTLNL